MTNLITTDIERLTSKVGVDGLHYENINESLEQQQRLGRWPLFREILETLKKPGYSGGNTRPQFLKITI